MPRASFSDVSKGGGFGFQEGRIEVRKSYSCMYQFPPNATTGKQSDEFPAMVWEGVKLNNDGKVVTDHEGNEETVEVVIRMGSKDADTGAFKIRPGRLAEKDFDNVDVEPEDLGTDVDPDIKGNSFVVDEGAKFSVGWGYIEESLKAKSFKPEILGRCVTTDFVGMDAHFKQEEGKKYIAKKGANKGQEVTPTNLVCDQIFVYPYDKKKGAGAASRTAPAAKAKANGSAAAAETKPAPAAAAANGNGGGDGEDQAFEAAKIIFGGGQHADINKGEKVDGLSPEFKKAVPADKEVKIDDFRKAMTSELMRRKVNPKLQKAIMEQVVRNDDKLGELAVFLMDNDKPTFSTDGTTIQFA